MVYYNLNEGQGMSWKVRFTKDVENKLKNDFKRGNITIEDIKIIKVWRNRIEQFGPEKIREIPVYDDHKLDKQWKGYRSSCFSSSGRIIYRIIDDEIIVEVVRITPDHNYGKE